MKNKILIILISSLIAMSCHKMAPCNQSERCHLTPDAGFCLAAFKKYYYDHTDKKCKEFIWGGCGGTVPFNTLQECIACECAE
jgi:Kunitz/Bovine pancreatic trypsin inhibitor domain